MGVIKHFSSSSGDKSVSIFSHWNDNKETIKVVNNYKSLPNPKPDNYKILKRVQIGKYLVVKIKYLDCTNYEGNKILVYETTWTKLSKQKLIDPHFCENKSFLSPIARFEPTFRGWKMAKSLCYKLS